MDRSWSLAKRITIWFAVTTTGLVSFGIGISLWYLDASLRREITALANEELEEMEAYFSAGSGGRDEFAEIAARLAVEHPEARFAWRVWDERTGEVWSRFGTLELFESGPPVQLDAGVTEDLGLGLVWKTKMLTPDLVVGLLLEDASQANLLKRTWISLIVFALVSALASTAVGALLGRRMAGFLRAVAESARSVHHPLEEEKFEVGAAPEEIRDVALALTDMLRNIRAEEERVQLLTAGMAHELRSPLQNLLGETEVALMRERAGSEYRKVLESHLDELRDLGRVVDNLVTLCSERRRSAGGQEVESFDLGREAELRLDREKLRARKRGIELEIENLGNLEFHGDREALLLALGNLISNAIRWSPEGSLVRVRLAGNAAGIEITVDDAGPGVDESLREKIFEPFFRGTPLKGHRIGYGLGLALTRMAVQAHGGSISVETSPAGGARFRMDLPRRAA